MKEIGQRCWTTKTETLERERKQGRADKGVGDGIKSRIV